MNGLSIPFPILAASLGCAACAVTDIRRFRVPNAMTLSLLASGLVYHAGTAGWPGLGQGLAGAAFGFAALLLPYSLGGMGAGDVKLLAGVGAWLGAAMTYEVLIAAALLGGVYALILAIASGRLRRTLSDAMALMSPGASRPEAPVQRVATDSDRRRRLVPFAAMVALAMIAMVVRL